jgi:H+/Cl- antiporter ClcA
VGQVFHTTASVRKVLLACGAAAGTSATFHTPIAGVILAIELLLFEFKARSCIPLVVASTLATAIHMQLLGAGPDVHGHGHGFRHPQRLAVLSGAGSDMRSGGSWVQQIVLLDGRPVREVAH